MDDHYRMIEQDIESLLDENPEVTIAPNETTPAMIRSDNFLSYKNLEVAAQEGPILGQYTKWSTVESDELNVNNHSVEQRNNLFAQMLPVYNSWTNLTIEMMQNILINLYNVQFRRNFTMTKKGCSFCKKNGRSFATYTSHSLRVNGDLECPYLLKCQCMYCWGKGHTTSYCPLKGTKQPFVDRNTVNQH